MSMDADFKFNEKMLEMFQHIIPAFSSCTGHEDITTKLIVEHLI